MMSQMVHVGTGYDVHPLVEGAQTRFGRARYSPPARLGWSFGRRCPSCTPSATPSSALAASATLDPFSRTPIPAGKALPIHFPPGSRPSSVKLSAYGRIVNIDSTIIAQEPKIMPHRDAMRDRYCHRLGSQLEQKSASKATAPTSIWASSVAVKASLAMAVAEGLTCRNQMAKAEIKLDENYRGTGENFRCMPAHHVGHRWIFLPPQPSLR